MAIYIFELLVSNLSSFIHIQLQLQLQLHSPRVMDDTQPPSSVMDHPQAPTAFIGSPQTPLPVVDTPEPTMVSQKRDRSPSPLFVQQDEGTPSPPEREFKRIKLEVRASTPTPTDEVNASQTSGSISSLSPTDQSDWMRNGTSSPSAFSDITAASAGETVTEVTSVKPFLSPLLVVPTQTNQLALQYKDIPLPANCPRLAAYHPLCEKTETDITRLCDDFISAYDQHKTAGFESAELESISRQFSTYRSVSKHYPPIKPVALAGPMGAGKSRTINSILDQPGLALDSDASDRGTNVVHEYLGPRPRQKAKYLVNVVYYSASQLNSRIANIVRSIYQYLSLENGSGDADVEDEDDLRSKFNSSLNFFRTILCDYEEFDSRETATAFFEEHFNEKTSEDELTEMLENLFYDFKASRKLVNDMESYIASDEAELSRIFAQVSKPQDMELQHPHPWPIIEKIQVRVRDNDLLKKGALVADTPGVADSDELVVNNTTMYLQNVGIVLIVSPILRTQRLNDLNDILRQCLVLGKAERTYLVMTKIDQKDPLKPHEIASLQPQFRQAFEAAEAQLVKLTQEIKDLNVKKDILLSQLSDSTKVIEFQQTHARLGLLPSLIKEQEAKKFQVAVEARNYDTELLLKNKFRELSKSGRAPDLKTIFVSNEEYQLVAQGMPSRLDPATTGIPGLQHILCEVPACDKFGTLQSIVEDHVAVSFRGAVLSLTKTKLERKEQVQNRLLCVLKQSTTVADSLKKSVERVFDQVLANAFDKREQSWQDKAQRLIKDWETFNSGNFTAFCRRSGAWKPKRKGQKERNKKSQMIFWNAMIQDIFSSDISKDLEEFWQGFDAAEICAQSNIRDWLDRLEDTLKACPEFQGASDTAMFYEMLHHVRDQAQKAVRQILRSLRRETTSVFHQVTMRDKAQENYVDKAMQPTYNAGAKIETKQFATTTGKKVSPGALAHDARVNLIRRKLMGTGSSPLPDGSDDTAENSQNDVVRRGAQLSVFQSVFEQLQDEFISKLDAAVSETSDKLKTTCDDIVTDFNRRYSVEEEQDTNDPQAKQQLLDAAHGALASIKGPIKLQLDEAKRWEKEGDIVVQT
ncbi:hypothetical protein M409DRAFT_24554 [Zasmidium cellare ATCC 36951]|uniref:DUF7605 domain-containing protein n=1 Tax=Zasmidium cellare ATCC 36951 TaxID=1080233 RepID=A0A6A6CG75_ZASCE|nr:uncharacterized protein M409DRAFT_24554 [Zasmidium cellare ATCC 36951]KAF2165168.1 hypothetical protein M409DRAFT_24554 [Zasmidium cellare ATCC 36951]